MDKDLIIIIIAACIYPFVIWAVISSIQMVIDEREYWKNEREKEKNVAPSVKGKGEENG